MNSPANFPTKTERLERALRSHTLGDVADFGRDVPRRRRIFDQFLTPDYRAVLLGLLEPEQEVLVVNELPDELRNAALADREPRRWPKLLSSWMTTMLPTSSMSYPMR